ncbi:MAG TPA: CpsD/CapB family tyrosine-protein kinase [Bryobacteraceae bacterium]|nr:CpsD/CapB family tyrosine-protein kinase [Bryobacteraceae bacterium]
MSRIFDALNRTDGGYEGLLRPLREQAVASAAYPGPPVAAQGPGLRDDLAEDVRVTRQATDSIERHLSVPQELDSQPGPSLRAGFGSVPIVNLRTPRSMPVLPFDGVHSAASEEYRKIRSRILHHPLQPQVFLVSSPCPGDGKTVTALNLGGALALKGSADVLVIDADFPRGTLAAITGIPDSPGLGEVLTGEAPLEGAIVRAAQFPRLHLLSAGRSAANPAELLDSEVWLGLMENLRHRFGYMVFDSPPVEAVPFYTRLVAACDGIVLVARPDHTGRDELNEALRGVPEDKLLGVVLNCNPAWLLYRRGFRGYNRYYSKV